MLVPRKAGCSPPGEKPNVFILHCGLDIKRVGRACEKLGLPVSMVQFRREEVFTYFVRLNRPGPDLIIIRSHFRSLVDSLNLPKSIPAIVISTHPEPAACRYPFIQADQGYEGTDAFGVYEQVAQAMFRELKGDGARNLECGATSSVEYPPTTIHSS